MDGQGKATFTTTSLNPGGHSITAVYQESDTFAGSVSKKLELAQSKTPSPVGLPRTGINALPVGLLGLNAILLGMGFILEARRREQGSF